MDNFFGCAKLLVIALIAHPQMIENAAIGVFTYG